MSRRLALLIAGCIIAVLIVGVWQLVRVPKASTTIDAFAQCLANKKVTMYGAAWCSHCQNEKRAFGNSFQYVAYVECPKETKRCIEIGIKGYPTWIFADGRRFEGEMGLERLAKESGCELSYIQ